ncbi:DNA-binding response regulator OS=Streptomyces fumanus OX=67302 GN=GCM10018772_10840 PE=4 SV=1 [Streptomyces fumanus]
MSTADRPSDRPVRVLVVDDQFLVRTGLVALLRAAPGTEVVGEAADGAEAVALAAATRPVTVPMHIRMPGMSGIEATERILAEAVDPAPRVLILTTFDLDEYVYGALRAGASGFLLKDAGPSGCWRRSRPCTAVTRCSRPRSPGVWWRRSPRASHPAPADSGPPPGLDTLTGRETEVLRLVARGLTNAETRRPAVHQRGHRQDPPQPGDVQAPAGQPDKAVVRYTAQVTPGDRGAG